MQIQTQTPLGNTFTHYATIAANHLAHQIKLERSNSKNTNAHQAFMKTTEEVFIVFLLRVIYLTFISLTFKVQSWMLEILGVTYLATNPSRRNPTANQMSSLTQREVKKHDHVSIVLQRWQLLALASRWECAALGVGCMVATRAGLHWNWDAV